MASSPMSPAHKKGGNRTRGAERRGHVQPAFEPTKEQRDTVVLLKGVGRPLDVIRRAIINPRTLKPIDEGTLRTAFADELENAETQLDLIVSASMMGQIKAGNTAMTIWYQKNRWSWTDRVESKSTTLLQGDPDKPLSFDVRFVKAAMTREEAFRQ